MNLKTILRISLTCTFIYTIALKASQKNHTTSLRDTKSNLKIIHLKDLSKESRETQSELLSKNKQKVAYYQAFQGESKHSFTSKKTHLESDNHTHECYEICECVCTGTIGCCLIIAIIHAKPEALNEATHAHYMKRD